TGAGGGAWRGSAGSASADQGAVDAASFGPERAGTAQADAPAAVPIEDLVGNTAAAHRLVEWLELTFDRPELLERLGGSGPRGGVVLGAGGGGEGTLPRP